jgi:hypothetical protein
MTATTNGQSFAFGFVVIGLVTVGFVPVWYLVLWMRRRASQQWANPDLFDPKAQLKRTLYRADRVKPLNWFGPCLVVVGVGCLIAGGALALAGK